MFLSRREMCIKALYMSDGITFVFTIRSNLGVRIMATREVEKSCSTSAMSSSYE